MKNITDEEIALAHEQLLKVNAQAALDKLSPADKALRLKYPKHTLEAARLIDSTPLPMITRGCSCAFDLIRLQETGNFHLSGDHT